MAGVGEDVKSTLICFGGMWMIKYLSKLKIHKLPDPVTHF